MPLTNAALQQMIEQIDQKHDDAHKRLRETCRDNEGWIVRLERKVNTQETAIATIKATPPEVGKLRFSTPLVFGIVAVCVSTGASIWASNSGLRSDMRNILTNQENTTRISDERAAQQRNDMAALKSDNQMWKYDIQAQFKELQKEVKELGDRIRSKP